MYGIDSACFLGETLGMIKLDYHAAKHVLEVVGSLAGLKADFDILVDDAQKVVEFLEWAKKEIADRGGPEESDENPSARYIG